MRTVADIRADCMTALESTKELLRALPMDTSMTPAWARRMLEVENYKIILKLDDIKPGLSFLYHTKLMTIAYGEQIVETHLEKVLDKYCELLSLKTDLPN